MGKFKVGDRVRCVDSEGTTCVVFGGEYEVESVGSQFVNLIGVRGGMYAYRFALIPTITIEPGKHYRLRNGKVTGRVSTGDIGFEALVDGQVKVFDKAGGAVFGGEDLVEAWVPKVGERVYVVYGHGWNGEGEVKDIAYQTFVVILKTGSRAGNSGGFTLQDIEPLLVAAPAQPAVLKIEAGRYYKTRDGRKVGPMVLADRGWFYVYEELGAWLANGKAEDKYTEEEFGDLIAEWVDEPVAVAASNDNVAKPKFKVGDFVRLAKWFPGYYEVTKIEGNNFWIKPQFGDDIKYQIEGGEWIVQTATPAPTAIVALIEDGAAKPSSKPKVHASQADATAEAERLALAYPGQLFGVFVLADSKIADVVNVPTPVLRAA